MYYHKLEIRKTKIVLVGSEEGLSRLMIDNKTKPVVLEDDWVENEAPFAEAKKQLAEYFEGKRFDFDLELNPKGTDFQKKAWQELQKVPYGQLATYKQVAEKLGNPNASRAVGLANNRNPIPIIVPCHRIVGSDKKLVGFAYGVDVKQQLIDHEKINLAFRLMAEHYGNINRPSWGGRQSWWPASTAFEMMMGAILTQNTNWKNVEQALKNLSANLNPQFILETSNEELALLIRPSGYHNQKAKKLKALCEWFKKYDFDTEKASAKNIDVLREELLAINGVGGETADSILVYALGKTSFVIDAYTRRIFGRLGIDVPKDYETFRIKMEHAVPMDLATYDYYHGLVVEHAKAHCNKTPNCQSCPLEPHCEKVDVSNQLSLEL